MTFEHLRREAEGNWGEKGMETRPAVFMLDKMEIH